MSRRKGLILGAVNIMLFLVFGILIITQHWNDITLYDIPLYSWRGEVDADNLFKADYPASKYWFTAKVEDLKTGFYTVTINYVATGDPCYLYCSSDVDGNSYPEIYADDYSISAGQKTLSFHVWVNSQLEYLNINIECGNTTNIDPDKSLYLDNIVVVREYRETVIYQMFQTVLLLLLLDVVILVIWNHDIVYVICRQNFYVMAGLICIFMIMSVDCLSNYQVLGHDMAFHYARIMGITKGLQAGEFPVRIQPGWINGYGYAASVFYGDVLLYIPAILYAIYVPIIYAYKFYILCINMITLLISYYCYKKLSGDKYIAVVCTALYCLSVNRILNVFLRAAVGEYSAFSFFPLVLLGMKEIFDEEKPSDNRYGWLHLCVGMTGIIQTHVLSFEMICIFIGITILILIKKLFKKGVLYTFVKSIVLTICLNLNFLLPFLDYSSENVLVLSEKAKYGIQGLGLSLYELISMGIITDGEAMLSTKGLARRFPASLGLPIVLIILLYVGVLVKNLQWEKKEKQRWKVVGGISAIALFMSTYYFPWNRLSAVPGVRNVVSSIQFPWRFISIAVPLLTYMACLLFLKLKSVLSEEKMKYLLVGICIICAVSGLQNIDSIIRRETGKNYVVYDGDKLFKEKETVSGAEYILEGTELDKALRDNTINGKKVQLFELQRQGNQIKISCHATGEGSYIDFPLFGYRYYQCVDVETNRKFNIERGENSKIRVPLPKDYEGILKVYFKEPWYWRVAEIISAVTVLAHIGYVVIDKKGHRLSEKLRKHI